MLQQVRLRVSRFPWEAEAREPGVRRATVEQLTRR